MTRLPKLNTLFFKSIFSSNLATFSSMPKAAGLLQPKAPIPTIPHSPPLLLDTSTNFFKFHNEAPTTLTENTKVVVINGNFLNEQGETEVYLKEKESFEWLREYLKGKGVRSAVLCSVNTTLEGLSPVTLEDQKIDKKVPAYRIPVTCLENHGEIPGFDDNNSWQFDDSPQF